MKASASTSKKNHRPKGREPATSAATPSRPATDATRASLLLFDIDGTLVLTGGAGRRAMSLAFQDVLGVRDAFQGLPMAGRTDSWILSDAAAVHGVALEPPLLDRFEHAYLDRLRQEIETPGDSRKGVMPGVRELLYALSPHNDTYLALLTGNYEEAARIKLEYFDLWRYFRCGAFGDDAPNRNGLLPKALSRIRECGGPAVAPADVVVIGDTPLDIECAAAAGARSIAVATG